MHTRTHAHTHRHTHTYTSTDQSRRPGLSPFVTQKRADTFEVSTIFGSALENLIGGFLFALFFCLLCGSFVVILQQNQGGRGGGGHVIIFAGEGAKRNKKTECFVKVSAGSARVSVA